jgi:hypothetical protein
VGSPVFAYEAAAEGPGANRIHCGLAV